MKIKEGGVMDVQQQRFELAIKEAFPNSPQYLNKNPDGTYRNTTTFGAWIGWKLAAKAQAVPEWISTSERMPEEGEEVLVHNLGQVRQVTRDSKWAGGFKERNCYGWQAAYSQSHWMPKSIELPKQYHFYYENDAKQKAMIEAQEPAND